jgi:hypothetical protein
MTTPPRKTSETPEWLIERLALGELDPATAAEVRARLAAEGRTLEGEVGALSISNREILNDHPPARVVAAVRRRAGVGPRGKARWALALPLALAGAAAILLVAHPTKHGTTATGTTGLPPTLEDTTIKGPAKVHVYRHGAGVDERLGDGARAARGDLLQLAYNAGERGVFGALLSIDGAGRVTLHWPEGAGPTAARLSAKGEVKLPSAYELDDAPAFERFVLVTSEAPFAMAPVLEAARALAARPDAHARDLALPPSLRQTSLTLEKSRKETP